MKKQTIQKLQKALRASLLFALPMTISAATSIAQVVPAVNTDSTLINSGWSHLNCAHIGYCGTGGSTGTGEGNPQGKTTIYIPPTGPCPTPFNLMAISYDHASGTFGAYGTEGNSTGGGGFLVSDLTHPPIQFTMPATTTWYDIIIGNSLTTGNYKVGITYTRNNDIFLDVYDVASPGGTMTVVYNNTYMISHSHTAHLSHIDIIADGATTSTAFANANKFAITWDDANGVNVYYASLDNPMIPGTTIPSIAPTGIWPDVAAIERGTVSSHQDYASLTYYVGSSLYEQDVNLTTGLISPAQLLDVKTTFLGLPRIDAVDDYNVNGAPTFTKWQVTVLNKNAVMAYNNNAYPTGLNCTSTFSTSVFEPCVAAGPGNNYSIDYFGPSQKVYAQKFDQSTGLLTSSNIYEVSKIGAAGANPAVSATCNTRQYLLSTWLVNNAVIYYKFSADPYAFKNGNTTGISSIPINHTELYPNPTTGILTVKGDYIAGDRYAISDISGRTVANGTLQSANQQINVNNLGNGTYFFNLQSVKGNTISKFVKQ